MDYKKSISWHPMDTYCAEKLYYKTLDVGQEEPPWFVPCAHGSYMKRDGTSPQSDDRLSRIPWQFWRSDTVKYAYLAGYKRFQIETVLDVFAHYTDKAAIWKYLVVYFGDPLGSSYAPADRCVAYDLGITEEEWGSLEMYRDKFRGYVQFSSAQEASDYLAVALPEVISCAKGVQPLVYSRRTNTYWNVQPGKVDSNIECWWAEANDSETKYVNVCVENKYGTESIPVRLDVRVEGGFYEDAETPDARAHAENMPWRNRAKGPPRPSEPRIPHAMTHRHLLYGCACSNPLAGCE